MHISRILLGPAEREAVGAGEEMLVVLVVFLETETEMHMAEIAVGTVSLAKFALRATARSVAAQANAHILDSVDVAVFIECEVGVYALLVVGILVEVGEELIPRVEAKFESDSRQRLHVEDIVNGAVGRTLIGSRLFLRGQLAGVVYGHIPAAAVGRGESQGAGGVGMIGVWHGSDPRGRDQGGVGSLHALYLEIYLSAAPVDGGDVAGHLRTFAHDHRGHAVRARAYFLSLYIKRSA